MTSMKRAVLYGLLLWLILFLVAFALFAIRTNARPLFESIMAVAVALATVLLAYRYFAHVTSGYLREGFLLGAVWMVINVLVDLPLMLSPSPMQMTASEYLADIGLTYLLIPVVTTGIGAVVQRSGGMTLNDPSKAS
jgi:hypothetical protein